MTTISGTVHTIRCQKTDTGWCAISIKTADNRLVSAAGVMPGLRLGMTVQLTGETEFTKWGQQLKVKEYTEIRPSDTEGIYKYLSSGLIRNIGPVFARNIVKKFGEDTLDILDNHPERLAEVSGIGKKRIKSVIEAVKEQKTVRTIMIWLKRHDLPNGLAAKIFRTYGEDSIPVLEENPYKLADDIKGVGFKKADDVARRLGLPPDSSFRIISGLKACLEDNSVQGNTYMVYNDLVKKTASEEYLSLPEASVEAILTSFEFYKTGHIEEDKVFLPKYYYAEKTIAEKIHALLQQFSSQETSFPNFERIESTTGIQFSTQQRNAITMAMKSPIMIMTGGPGTGKTTTTKAIINELLHHGKKIVLTAPTGRAAKHMTEATGVPSKTIHRLLEYQQGEFQRNEDFPIEGDAIIVDEASMIDTLLMRDFLKAVAPATKLIIVGDIDQLPSVGAGSVLRDMISSGQIPTVMLTEIYRQAQGSDIIMNAHKINNGKMPYFKEKGQEKDFHFREIEDKDELADTIIQSVKSIVEKSSFTADDVQVLSPMRREWDPIGSTILNARLQDALNPDGLHVATRGGTQFRKGDRIMQTKNNYDKNIFNGDIGTVLEKLSGEDEDKAVMSAVFDGTVVRFTQEDLSDIELSYACTVHKSQGSEYPVVIMPIHKSQYIMLKRNLLYTGITRAKKHCIILGTKDAIYMAASRPDTQVRLTCLTQRITETLKDNIPNW